MKRKRPGQGTGHGTGKLQPLELHERLLRRKGRKILKRRARRAKR